MMDRVWDLKNLFQHFTSSLKHTVENAHALHFPDKGYTRVGDNEVRYEMAKLINEVCHTVSVEPNLIRESFHNNSTACEDEA